MAQGVVIKVGLSGAATTRREADSTGRSISKIGDVAEHTGHKMKLAELSTKSWEKSSEKLKDVLKDLAGVTGIAGLAFGTGEIVKSAIQAQNAQLKLRQTLKNTGLSWGKYGESIEKAVDKQAIRSGFGPADVTESFTNSLRTTRTVTGALKLNALALDVARAKGMNLAGAQSLLARVYNGSYLGLKRLGIGITNITTEQDALRDSGKKYTRDQLARAKADDKAATKTEALRLVRQNFGKLAAAQAKGAQGSIDRLKSALEVVQEKLGAVILPYVAQGASKLAGLATKVGENWPKISATISRDAAKVKAKLAPLISFISQHRKTVLAFAGAFIGLAAAMKTLKGVGKLTGLETVAKHLPGTKNIAGPSGSKSRPFYVRVLSGTSRSSGGGPGGASGAVGAVGALAKRFGLVEAGIGIEESIRTGSLRKGIDAADPTNFLNLFGKKSLHQAGSRYSGKKGWGNLARDLGLTGSAPAPSRSVMPTFQNGIPILAPNTAAIRQANGGSPASTPSNPATSAIVNGGFGMITVPVYIDGKQVARAVTHAANKKKALK